MDRALPRWDAVVQFGIDGLQKGVFRPQQQVAVFRHLAGVPGVHICNEVLVQEQIAVMNPVGNIIDNKDASYQWA